MTGVLRLVGILNAAVWFGATLFFILIIQPAAFSSEMKVLLGDRNFPFFSEAIAGLLAGRYYHLQLACAIVALLHLVAERLYWGKAPATRWLGLLSGLLVLSLISSAWLQPNLKTFNTVRFSPNSSPEQRQAAQGSFTSWHRFLVVVNFLTLLGVTAYLGRLAMASEPTRFLHAGKFRS